MEGNPRIERLSGGKTGRFCHYFFGYYDKSPWNYTGRRILAHRTTFLDRFPKPGDHADIGYVSAEDGYRFTKVSETTAWNWQQGAQLQWLPRHDSGEGRILFNVRRKDQLGAAILDLDSRTRQEIEFPVYTVSPGGRCALSLNYARLFDVRMDYGISGLVDPCKDVARPEDDGIYRVDLQTGAHDLILSIAQVAGMRPSPLGEASKHWVNHMMFNPSGKRLCFLHRFKREDGIVHSRLFTGDVSGGDLRLLFEGMVSHYCWQNETTIVAWAGRRRILGSPSSRPGLVKTALRRCLKPIYYALGKPRILMQRIVGDSYCRIEDREGGAIESLAYGKLTCDGHCTLSPDGRWLLTDGYTDSHNRLPLFLYDLAKREVVEVGRYATPKELDGPMRVDLHPRFNADGTKICIDSAMDGTRQVYVIDVSEIVTGR
jgi:hypothetical protein